MATIEVRDSREREDLIQIVKNEELRVLATLSFSIMIYDILLSGTRVRPDASTSLPRVPGLIGLGRGRCHCKRQSVARPVRSAPRRPAR